MFACSVIKYKLGKMDYKSKRWKKKRQIILKLDGYKDVIAKRYGKNIEATIVHHIYPAELYPEYQFENWNLISVSAKTHNTLHDRVTDELTDEGLKLMKRTIPGKNWREKQFKTV